MRFGDRGSSRSICHETRESYDKLSWPFESGSSHPQAVAFASGTEAQFRDHRVRRVHQVYDHSDRNLPSREGLREWGGGCAAPSTAYTLK